MHITGMVHININCTDFQRSKAFYEMLGFQVYWPVDLKAKHLVERFGALEVGAIDIDVHHAGDMHCFLLFSGVITCRESRLGCLLEAHVVGGMSRGEL